MITHRFNRSSGSASVSMQPKTSPSPRGEGVGRGASLSQPSQSVLSEIPIRPVPACAGAFTLIEVVVSAALMAMILVSAYLCLNAGVASQKLIEPRIEIFQNARVALALLSADLRAACPLSTNYQFIGEQRTMGEVETDTLDFATHNYHPGRATGRGISAR